MAFIIFFLASAYSRSRVLSETWCLSAISVLVNPTLPEHHFSTRMSYCRSDNPHTCFIARNLSLHRPLEYVLNSLISSPIAPLFLYHRTSYATFRKAIGENLANFWRIFGKNLAENISISTRPYSHRRTTIWQNLLQTEKVMPP